MPITAHNKGTIGRTTILTALFLLLVMPVLSHATALPNANTTCHGKFINPLTDVCWSCIFPLTIGKSAVVKGHLPDTSNPSSPICACPAPAPIFERVGLSVGFWEPIRLIDVTRTPFCMVNLGGIQFQMGKHYGHGSVNTITPEAGGSRYHVHWYAFPLLYWLNVLTDAACVDQGDFDLAYLTELDPTWHDDELSFILNPEAILFANTVTQRACSLDSIAASGHLAIDRLFWCLGSQGSSYPLTGSVAAHIGGVQASTLLAERMTFKMQREGLLWDSVGKNGHALCRSHPTPILPKSRYRYQMTYPLPAVHHPQGCQPFGRSTALWGAGREFPIKGKDFGYLIWCKRNCCSF